jgi:MoaA/NifB/PqqE/SkfB family radical SAM enzyme
MTDVLIRNVNEEDLARIDDQAARLGLSRSEYLRRQIVQTAARGSRDVTVEDLRRAAELSKDLLDHDVLRDAWS